MTKSRTSVQKLISHFGSHEILGMSIRLNDVGQDSGTNRAICAAVELFFCQPLKPMLHEIERDCAHGRKAT